MNVREAIDNGKALKETLDTLLAAVSGVDEKQLDGLIKQRDAFLTQAADAKEKSRQSGTELADKLAADEAAYRVAKGSKQKEIDALDMKIDERRKALSTMEHEKLQTIQDETARLVTERNAQITRLDNAIKVKGKQLDELTKALEEGKRKVANI